MSGNCCDAVENLQRLNMSILKIKKASKTNDGNRLIREDIFNSETPARSQRTLPEPQSRSWIFLFSGIALVAVAGLVFWIVKNHEKEAPVPYVFFDIKAIDTLGHPVAGAQVTVQDKRAGTTDSFGEWRRFMRTKLGSQVAVKVVKNYQNNAISSSKSLTIPPALPVEGEIEMALTLQLLPSNIQDAHTSATEASNHSKNEAILPKNEAIKDETAAKTISPYDSIWFSLAPAPTENIAAPDQVGLAFLRDKIMPSLQSRAKILGVVVDSKAQWQIVLRHIRGSAAQDSKGIVLVSATMPGNDSKIEFLKNYQTDPLATARSILWGLKMHGARGYNVFKKDENWYVDALKGGSYLWSLTDGMVLMGPRGKSFPISVPTAVNSSEKVRLLVSDVDPCERKGVLRTSCILYSSHVGVTPPAANWGRLKIQVYGIPEGSSVFVSGYLAIHEGGKIWSYWGVPNSDANLTVLSNGSITFRRKISSPANQTPVITIPVANMSQK
jgi:hypothetical protein